MKLRHLVPRRMAHFGSTNYTYVSWLRRKWHVRPYHGTMRDWLGVF